MKRVVLEEADCVVIANHRASSKSPRRHLRAGAKAETELVATRASTTDLKNFMLMFVWIVRTSEGYGWIWFCILDAKGKRKPSARVGPWCVTAEFIHLYPLPRPESMNE
jgi:hypothetical protein